MLENTLRYIQQIESLQRSTRVKGCLERKEKKTAMKKINVMKVFLMQFSIFNISVLNVANIRFPLKEGREYSLSQ